MAAKRKRVGLKGGGDLQQHLSDKFPSRDNRNKFLLFSAFLPWVFVHAWAIRRGAQGARDLLCSSLVVGDLDLAKVLALDWEEFPAMRHLRLWVQGRDILVVDRIVEEFCLGKEVLEWTLLGVFCFRLVAVGKILTGISL